MFNEPWDCIDLDRAYPGNHDRKILLIMASSKALNSRSISSVAAVALKTVGVIIILAALLDMITLPFPAKPLDRQWQINFVTLAVDRGIVPMVGLALLLTGYWVDTISGLGLGDRRSWKNLGFWALILSSVFGLFYILAVPLHLNNVRVSNTEAIERIKQDASQAEAQLNNRLQTEVGQQRQQIEQLIANPEQIDRAREAGQITLDQATQLQQFRQNPKALDQFIEKRVGEVKGKLQTEIGQRREDALNNVKNESIKSGLRVGISSLLLAIGYILIGWIGLRYWGDSSR